MVCRCDQVDRTRSGLDAALRLARRGRPRELQAGRSLSVPTGPRRLANPFKKMPAVQCAPPAFLRMAISLRPQHLNRYRQIAWLLVKYGRSDLVKQSGLEETLAAEQRATPKEKAKADELANDLEQLGPTFVKLGQLLSTRVELMPQSYIKALTRLQDK